MTSRVLAAVSHLIPEADWTEGILANGRVVILRGRHRYTGRPATVSFTPDEAAHADPCSRWLRGRVWAVRGELGLDNRELVRYTGA